MLQLSLKTLRWNSLLPQGSWGDQWHAYLHCLRYNGHWPRAVAGGIDDFLVFLKASPEMEAQRRIRLTDKYLLKAEVEHLLGKQWAIPTLGLLETASQVMQHEFPPHCVIKPNHLSGEIIYRRNGEPVDRARIARWLSASHYRRTRERNYLGLRPLVLIEPWLELVEGRSTRVYCLRGEPRIVVMSMNRPGGGRYRGAFDPKGNFLGYTLFGTTEANISVVEQPQANIAQLTELLWAARIMARGLLFARVDTLHSTQGMVVNEVTSVPFSGASRATPAGSELDFAQQLFGPQGFNLVDFPELNARSAWGTEKI